jgi:predicted metal-dependent phosphoesterase TrpH
MSTLPVINSFCRECYSHPEEVYERLKRSGMDLVTVTDHDSIGAADSLRRYPDFFLSEEVTCRMPSGTEVHLGVYGIDERQHAGIQARRDDLPRLLRYLEEQRILFSLNHAFSSLTGKRDPVDFDWFSARFPVLEGLNGHLLPGNNRLANELAGAHGRGVIAGSDAHTVLSAGSAFTEVPGARNPEEFIQGLRCGRGRVHGDPGNYWKLTRDVLLIALESVRENPALSPLTPLALAIPVVTLLNCVLEARFARRYERYATNHRLRRFDALTPPTPLGSPEVIA